MLTIMHGKILVAGSGVSLNILVPVMPHEHIMHLHCRSLWIHILLVVTILPNLLLNLNQLLYSFTCTSTFCDMYSVHVHVCYNHTSSLMQVGDLEDSSIYIRMKSKAAAEVGIAVKHLKLSRQVC